MKEKIINLPKLKVDQPDLKVITTTVTGNEPCLSLVEVHKNSPQGKGPFRYQILYVMRNDKPAEFSKKMGLASKYGGIRQFRVCGGVVDETTDKVYIEHTVDELIEMANQLRETPPFDLLDRFENRRVV